MSCTYSYRNFLDVLINCMIPQLGTRFCKIHMKLIMNVLWELVFWSSVFYAFSLPPVHIPDRKATLDLDLANTTRSIATPRQKSCRSELGFEPNVNSCKNAWGKMPLDSDVFLYQTRENIAAGAHFGVGLPVRFLGDDGLCAIDIRAKEESERLFSISGDSARNVDVSKAAKFVLDECVSIRRRGGYITGFSQRNLLAVIITKYEPKAVCESDPEDIPFVPFCERVLQTMPARRQKDWFASIEDHPTSRFYPLPKMIQYREFSVIPLPLVCQLEFGTHQRLTQVSALAATGPRCAVTVSKDQQSPYCKASWFDFWAAGVAISTVCVRKGMSGSVHGLGELDHPSGHVRSSRNRGT